MLDPAIALLLQPLAAATGPCLWVADENSLSALPHLAPFAQKLSLLSNRWDIVDAARTLGIHSYFSDAHWPEDTVFEQCFFRIAKEKPLVHHIINQAHQHLAPNGTLWLAGFKNEGTKTYSDKAAKLFGHTQKAQKHGEVYLCALPQNPKPAGELLDTQDYPALRPVYLLDDQPVYSKPGVYGWDKIDAGSQMLVHELRHQLPLDKTIASCLDLGCGYGFLSLALADYTITRRVATDNNLTALLAMEQNSETWGLDLEAIPSNCADTINEQFELIICNPPFHKGFDTQNDLTELFLRSAKTHLAPKGAAWFVVNDFIPIEQKAKRLFKHGQLLGHNRQFKVLKCWQ